MAGHRHVFLASALFLAGGCYQGTEEPADIAATRDMHNNALTFNGIVFNGLTFNGLTFNGLTFNGLTFNGLTFNGLNLDGTSFSGFYWNGKKFVFRSGEDMVGSEFNVRYTQWVNGKKLSEEFVLHVDDIY